jgi:hypothetical protein
MLFGLAQSLRSLTRASPITTAVNEAHRMARRRLDAGGSVAAPRRVVDNHPAPADFLLPPDIDPDEVAKAIGAKLRGNAGSPSARQTGARPVLERQAGGRVIVPGYHLLRLGDGRFDRGRRFMRGVIGQIRAKRKRGR